MSPSAEARPRRLVAVLPAVVGLVLGAGAGCTTAPAVPRADAAADRTADAGDARNRPALQATVERSGDNPLLRIGGAWAAAPGFYVYGEPGVESFREVAASNVRVFHVGTNALGDNSGFTSAVSPAPGVWDFREIDRRIAAVLEARPDAQLFVRVYAGVPAWWLDQHPSELELDAEGRSTFVDTFGQPRRFPSLDSGAYRAAIVDGLERLIDHLERQGVAERVVGYVLLGLGSEEWYRFDTWSDAGQYPADSPARRVRPACYSPHTAAAFRRWLQTRYGTVAALNAAWGTGLSDFADAAVPPEAALRGTGEFRAVPAEMGVVDFLAFWNDQIPDTIATFAAAIKRRTGRRALVGAIYGYMNEFRGNPTFGHNSLAAYASNPDLDFMLVEASQTSREMGGADLERAGIESLRRAGKLVLFDDDAGTVRAAQVYDRLCEVYYTSWRAILATCDPSSGCDEAQRAAWRGYDSCRVDPACVNDVTTDRGPWSEPPASCGTDLVCRYVYRRLIPYCIPARRDDLFVTNGFGPSFTLAQNESMLLRYAAFALARGVQFNYFSLWTLTAGMSGTTRGLTTYSDPGLLAFVARLNQRLDAVAPTPRRSASQVLVLSDERSTHFFHPLSEVLAHGLSPVRVALTQSGAPYDHALLSDLATLDVSRYRLVVMLDAFNLTDAQRRLIRTRLMSDGRVILWNYAPGHFNEGRTVPVQDITAIAGHWQDEVRRPGFEITDPAPRGAAGHPLAAALWRNAIPYGQPRDPGFSDRCCRLLVVDDPGATTLAYYPGTGVPSMVVRDQGSWTSLWTAAVDLPPWVFREIARFAGVHIYNGANDTLYADDTFIAVHGFAPGPRTLEFPGPVRLRDLLTDAPLSMRAGDPTRYDFAVEVGETRVLRIER